MNLIYKKKSSKYLYCLLNNNNRGLKMFSPRTWCTKNLLGVESYTTWIPLNVVSSTSFKKCGIILLIVYHIVIFFTSSKFSVCFSIIFENKMVLKSIFQVYKIAQCLVDQEVFTNNKRYKTPLKKLLIHTNITVFP